MKTATEIIRFDVELEPAEMEKLNELCKQSYRTRKNFAESLILLILRTEGTIIDLTKLGVVR